MFDRTAYGHYGLLAAAVIAVSILVSTAGTHSRIPWLNDPPPRKLTPKILVSEVLGTLANRSLWVATASGVFFSAAQGVAAALATYFYVYYWELTPAQLSYLVTGGLAGSFAGIVLGPKVTERLGKKRGAMVLFAAAFVAAAAPLVLRLAGFLPTNGTPLVMGALVGETVLTGALGLMLNIAVTSMIADIAEDSEVKTGRRSEGLLVSADNFLKKTTSGVGVFASSLMLGLVHFPAKAKPGQVPADALHSLALMYLPTLGALHLGAILCIIAYRIDRTQHEQNLRVLRERAEPAR
jgi:Na+/melibiose symporter-like transporter